MDNTKRIVNKTLLDDIADAIREKEGSSESIVASTFPERILGIETGTDMSDATATTDDILEGKTAYLSDGSKHSGTMQTWDGTITGSFEYAYPYADFDTILGGVGSIYSGYCPSVIRNNAFGAVYDGLSFLSEFCPTFSSNWSVITVGSAAFISQSNLTKVNFLSSSCYKILEGSAFFSCSKLSTPVVNVISTSRSCFEQCYSLPYFSTIYSGTVSLGTWGMQSAGFSYIYISCQNLDLGRGACANLYSCPSISFNVAEELIFGGLDFKSCLALSEVSCIKISGNGTPEGLCSGCVNLEKVFLEYKQPTLTYNAFSLFRSYCFADCEKLSMVSIEAFVASSIIRFYSNCFRNCSTLTSISITNLSTIDPNIFSLYFSVIIDQSAFYKCSNLKSLPEYPFNYTSGTLAYSAFYECTNFRFFKTTRNLRSVFSWAFYNCHKLSFFYSPALTGIQSSAFQNCSSLKSFILYSSGIYGEKGNLSGTVFNGCVSLESYYHLTPAVGTLQNVDTFSSTPIADSTYLGYYGSIYVRQSLLESYKAATNWTFYSDRMVGVTDEEAEAIIQAFQNTSYVEEIENE